MADVATLVIRVTSDVKSATSGLDDVTSRSDKMRSGVATAAKVATGVLLGLGAAAIAAGKAAAEDAQSQAVLANTLTKSTGATKAQIAQTEDWITSMALATGVADDQLRPALGTLARATGSVTKSQDALQVALDVAAATGTDVESVSKALAKGYAGQTTAIGRLVPGLDKAVLASGDMDAVMGELQKKMGGSAAAAADTTAGQMARATVAFDEAKESIGAGLLPVMTILATMLAKVGKVAMEHPKAFQVLAIAIAAVAAAIIVLNVALTVMNVLLSPITLIVLAIVAAIALLVIGFVLLYKKSELFRTAVNAMLDGIVAGVKFVAQAWKQYFTNTIEAAKTIVAALRAAWTAAVNGMTNVIQNFRNAVTAVWNAIRNTVGNVADAVQNAWRATFSWISGKVGDVRENIVDAFQAAKNRVGTIVDGIETAWRNTIQTLKNIVSGLGETLSAPFNAIKNAVDNAIGAVRSLIDWLGRIKIPKLPKGLSGLLGRSATAAVATPEGVAARGYLAPAVAMPVTRASSSSGGITINVTGAIDPEATARQIERILSGHRRRVGLVPA